MKINNKHNKSTIKYVQKKEHKCGKIELKKEDVNICSTESELIKRAEQIIKINPLKLLSYHMIKLNENNIIISKVKANRLITKIRNKIYPHDKDYILYINQIKIIFDDSVDSAKDLSFCPKFQIHKSIKKNREEQYIIFTSIFHLKFLTKCNQIFIDATFKSISKNFYQILNIMAYNENENLFMPISFILMTNKSLMSYEKIFDDIISLLKTYSIDINFKNLRFLCDFEKSLLKAIKGKFKESKINGCYFHYIKSLWKKMRNFGLTKKNILNNTKIIIFSFIDYFKKNCELSQFLNFDKINICELINRTNNIVESFHH